MKKAFLALSMAATVVMSHSVVLAKPTTSKKDAEDKLSARIIEQVLTSIQFESLKADFNINKMSIEGKKDAKTGDTQNKVNIADANLQVLIPFKRDWLVDRVITPKENTPRNANTDKLIPSVHASAASLFLAVVVKKSSHIATMNADFFAYTNAATGKWNSKPLTVTARNEMTKGISEIRFHSFSAEVRENPTNPDDKTIAGICKAEKLGFDMATRQNRMKEVNCQFQGVWTNEGYKIDLVFADK